MTDPFSAAIGAFRAGSRPAAVRVTPDADSDADDRYQVPRPDQCPASRRAPGGADVWHLDDLGTPRQLLDHDGRVVVIREERELARAVRAAGRTWT